MSMSMEKKALINQTGGYTFVWATLQQIIVAISTFLIIRAMELVNTGRTQDSLPYLGLFLLSLIVVYVPNALATSCSELWGLRSFDIFIKAFRAKNFGKVSYAHPREKTRYEPWITSEAQSIYRDSTSTLFHLYSTSLNVVLNIAVIGVMVDLALIPYYVVAGVLLMCSKLFFASKIEACSITLQKSRNNLSSAMLSCWDNILIGNKYNASIWNNRYSDRYNKVKDDVKVYEITKSLISSGTTVLALLVIAGGLVGFFQTHLQDIGKISSMIVTLPRQIQILQSVFMFFSLFLAWKGAMVRISEMSSSLDLPVDSAKTKSFVSADKLIISKGEQIISFSKVEKIVEFIELQRSGRITLRGDNGTGKSSFLSYLSSSLGNSAFYLPSKNEKFLFLENNLENLSDGQRIKVILREIDNLDVKCIILDEWDANLDKGNITELDQKIGIMSRDYLIVEVRHR